jgi:probable rRNA maturation factor
MTGKADIAVVLLSPKWKASLADHTGLVRRAAEAALASRSRLGRLELTIALADDGRVRALNRDYRGRDKPTNVLSFPGEAAEPGRRRRPRHLGDVVLALGQVGREARQQKKRLADHVSHLVVHGVLHLLGHDHEREAEADAMEALEVTILAGLGIADPYRQPSAVRP